MKTNIHKILTLLALLPIAVAAWAYEEKDRMVENSLETRIQVGFTKDLPLGFSVGLEQDLRAKMVETIRTLSTPNTIQHNDPYIRRMYTTLSLGYQPIEYFAIDAAYILRIYGDRWTSTDPRDYLRHRVEIGLTAQYPYRQWKFAFTEQLRVDCRMDEVNPYEQNKTNLKLKHIFKTDYSFRGTPWQLKGKIELHNTLNAPDHYLHMQFCPPLDYTSGQYLSSVRVEIGARWKFADLHALTLSYRYQYDYDRELEVTMLPYGGSPYAMTPPPPGTMLPHTAITKIASHSHIIILAYELGW